MTPGTALPTASGHAIARRALAGLLGFCSAWVGLWIGSLFMANGQALAVGVPALTIGALVYLSIKFAWWQGLRERHLFVAVAAAGVVATLMLFWA